MANRNEWKASNTIGKLGEAALVDYWTVAEGNVPEDKSGDKHFQEIDVDFVGSLYGYPNSRLLLEAKADTKDMKSRVAEGGSILVETIANDQKDTPGWIVKTQANLVSVYKAQTRKLFILRRKELFEFCRDHYNDRRYFHYWAPNHTNDGSLAYSSENMIIPRADLVAAGIVWRVAYHTGKPVHTKDGWTGFGDWYHMAGYGLTLPEQEADFRQLVISTDRAV